MSQLTLRSIKTRGAVVPLARPLPTKVVTLTTAPLVLIDIETDEGVTGHAYGFAYLERAILAHPLKVSDGQAIPADRPGTGVERKEDAVRSCAVKS